MLDQVINPPCRMTNTHQIPNIKSQQHRLILVIPPERLVHRHFRPHQALRNGLYVHQHRLLWDPWLRHT